MKFGCAHSCRSGCISLFFGMLNSSDLNNIKSYAGVGVCMCKKAYMGPCCAGWLCLIVLWCVFFVLVMCFCFKCLARHRRVCCW